jgi:protoporphyrinogen oxidase
MVDIAVRGRRPIGTGHWCYYSDETIAFNRLIFMHEFDPHMAPDGGWGLMAEITERAEDPLGDLQERVCRCINDARRVGALQDEDEVVEARARVIDPAYVVFTPATAQIIERARARLRDHTVTPLGRYGRWEYSSMAQVMRDGFSWGRHLANRLGYRAPGDLRWGAELPPGSEP